MKKERIRANDNTGRVVAVVIVLYIAIGLFPFIGRVRVSDETRANFRVEDFFAEEASPERVMLLVEPQEAFRQRIDLISNARYEIMLSSFAFRSGETSDIVVGALLAAADRGVNITVLNNQVGGAMPAGYQRVLARHPRISVHIFNPLRLHQPQSINTAMHDKYMIVDGRFMIMGGRNIGDRDFNPDSFTGRVSLDKEVLVYNTDPAFSGAIAHTAVYFNEKLSAPRIRTVRAGHVRLRDTSAEDFLSSYRAFAGERPLVPVDFYTLTVPANRITLVHNPIHVPRRDSVVAFTLLQLAAHSDVVVAHSPYVTLTRRNLQHLTDVAAGRDFTLVTNSLASTPNMPSFSAYYVSRRNLAPYMHIYEFQSTEASLHGKVYLFDGRLTAIGSFNLNERSARSDTETMLIIDSEYFHAIVLEALHDLMAQSIRVGADNQYVTDSAIEPAHASWGKRFTYRAAGIVFRPLRFMF
ncbi:MAG: phospholipase D-like domain-containing protein [Defluviitaleaceae bacterium]|nr:phospholipase D-like domain-containing protein [Defluviitaleaceae bacterium]